MKANAASVDAYREHMAEHPELVEAARTELSGWDLACFCPPEVDGQPLPRHVDVLLDVVAGNDP